MAVDSTTTDKTYSPGSLMAAEALTGIVFLDPDHLVVEHWAAGATSGTVLERDVDYEIGGDGTTASGTITALASWPAADEFRVYRLTPATQGETFPAHEPFSSADAERGLDKRALVEQELRAEQARALMVPRGETAPAVLLDGMAEGDSLVADADGNLIPSGDSAFATTLAALVAEGEAVAAAIEAALPALVAAGGYTYDAVTGLRRKWDGTEWAIAPHVYLDPVNGNDSYDGNAATHQGGTVGPKLTRGGVEAHAAMVANAADDTPVTIGLVAGADWWRGGFDYFTASSRNGNNTRNNIHLVGVGSALAKISCCDVIAAGSFAAHGTIANAYTVSVPHEMLDASGTNYTSVFVNGERLQYRNTEAECSNPGTWYAASNGAATPGVPLAITVHFAGSVAPAAAGTIEVTTRTTAFAAQDNCHVEGIWAFGSGSNNGSIVINSNGRKVRCLMEDGTKHNGYIGGGSVATDCLAINCGRSDDERLGALSYGGGLFVAYGSGSTFVSGMDAEYVRCGVIIDDTGFAASDAGAGQSQPWYSHASGYLGTIRHTDCWDSGCSLGSSTQAVTGVVLSGHTSFSDFVANTNVYSATVSGATVTVEDSFFFGSCNQSMFSSGDITVRRSMIAGNYNWLTFGSPRATWTDNIMVSVPSSDVDQKVVNLNPTTIESIVVNNNVFVGVFIPYVLDYASAAAVDHAKLTIDANLYVVTPDGGGNHYMATISGASKTMAQWQALGEDVNSVLIQASNTAATNALFTTGTRPTAITLDARLDAAGQGADYVRFLTDETKWQRAVGLPRTKAAGVAHLAALVRDAVWLEAA